MFLLDREIRDWVLLPIMALVVLVTLLKAELNRWLLSNTSNQSAETLADIKERNALRRAKLFSENYHCLSPHGFMSRKQFFLEQLITYKVERPNPMFDPRSIEKMTSHLSRSLLTIIPEMIMMTGISYVFDGFVAVKIPFQLTPQFKEMLQRGIETTNLDASWVSSLSWYFLCLFGLTSLINALTGNDYDRLKDLQMQQPHMLMQTENAKTFEMEVEQIKCTNYFSCIESA